jgi:hypothetical protein
LLSNYCAINNKLYNSLILFNKKVEVTWWR